jgi:hypothetical protein
MKQPTGTMLAIAALFTLVLMLCGVSAGVWAQDGP